MKWGVLVPVYQAADTLGVALASVVGQSLLPDQICVVIDGSTDESERVARGFAREYPNMDWVIEVQENKGLGSARNAGIKVLQTQYIALLDADDRWHPHKLRHADDFLRQHPGTDLLYHPVWEWDEVRGSKRRRRDLPLRGIADLWKHNPLIPSATIIRSGFGTWLFSTDREIHGVEDTLLWSEVMIGNGVIRRMPHRDTDYRINHGMSSQLETHEKRVKTALDRAIKSGWIAGDARVEIDRSRAYLKARTWHKQGKFKEAIREYRRADRKIRSFLLRIVAHLGWVV